MIILKQNALSGTGVKKLYVTSKLCVNNTRMQGIDSHSSSLQSLGQLTSKQYVGQFALIVCLDTAIWFLAVQIIKINFAICMRQAGDVNNTTRGRFLRRRRISYFLFTSYVEEMSLSPLTDPAANW